MIWMSGPLPPLEASIVTPRTDALAMLYKSLPLLSLPAYRAMGTMVGMTRHILTVACVIAGLAGCASTEKYVEPEFMTASPLAVSDAITYCKQYVLMELDCPSTAKFANDQHVSLTYDIRENTTSIRVTGHVDAQNLFGGTPRLTYYVTWRRPGRHADMVPGLTDKMSVFVFKF